MKYLFCALFALLPLLATAQNKVTLSGYVRDARSNESLMAATVYIKELGIGAQTNNYGFYSITVPAGQLHFYFFLRWLCFARAEYAMIESRTL